MHGDTMTEGRITHGGPKLEPEAGPSSTSKASRPPWVGPSPSSARPGRAGSRRQRASLCALPVQVGDASALLHRESLTALLLLSNSHGVAPTVTYSNLVSLEHASPLIVRVTELSNLA